MAYYETEPYFGRKSLLSNKKLRRAIRYIVSILLGWYASMLVIFWIGAERAAWLGSQELFSPIVNLGEKGACTWEVPRQEWRLRKGEGDFSLAFSDPERSVDRNKTETPLRVRVDAYTYENEERATRLVKDSYFTSDEPFSPEVRIWESYGGDHFEWGLGRTTVNPEEPLFIELAVLEPDKGLADGETRLKIVSKHDYAIHHHLWPIRIVHSFIALVCLVFAVKLLLPRSKAADAPTVMPPE
ncbi:hypothetical protein ACFL1X_05605 [Candidatus Hydrogenedentota bacterium]